MGTVLLVFYKDLNRRECFSQNKNAFYNEKTVFTIAVTSVTYLFQRTIKNQMHFISTFKNELSTSLAINILKCTCLLYAVRRAENIQNMNSVQKCTIFMEMYTFRPFRFLIPVPR